MSKTNFFSQLGEKGVENLSFTFDKTDDNQYMVIVKQNSKFEDDGAKIIPPQVLRGTLEELDNLFFEEAQNPTQEVAKFMSNVDTYHKVKIEADKATKEAKDKKDAEDKIKKDAEDKIKKLVDSLDDIYKEDGFDLKNETFNQKVIKAADKILAVDPENKKALEKKKEAQEVSSMPSLF